MDGSVERGGLAACPACVALPGMGDVAAGGVAEKELLLSLPEIHCAACISGVERVLAAQPGVASARVNLTLKRATVDAEDAVEPGALVAALGAAGFKAQELDAGLLSSTEADKAGRDLLMRLAVAGFAMMNVMLLSVAVWSGAEGATRDLFHWISAAIAFPAVGFAGRPFFASAAVALKARRLNMDVPITLAILLALGTSLYETIHSGAHAYFDAALSLTFFLLAGRYLDYRTRAVARSAAEELAALEVPRAVRLVDGAEETVGVGELVPGDVVLVRPGGRMPVDGVIVEGASELDRALLTGETRPVAAEVGQVVSAGEVNLTGPLTVRVTAAGKDSSLHRMADLVAVAESAKNKYTSLADRAAGLYAPGVHILSALAGIGWFVATMDARVALNIAAAVLIITCPCALGLAVPAVVTAASGKLFRKGLLIKDGTALERLAEVSHVVFDKTGTLTMGTPDPVNLSDVPEAAKRAALSLAMGSSHPLAVALTGALRAEGVLPLPVEGLREVPGYGTEAMADGRALRLGRAEWVGAEAGEDTATWLSLEGAAPVAFTFADRLRPGAAEAVAALTAAGCEVELLSGDAPRAVARFAKALGIDTFRAGVLPAEKAARVEALQAGGAKVLMVGDGLNDTAALAAAHASVSPATALDAARVASDIVLLGESVAPVADAVTMSRRAVKRIRENFQIATAYNVIAVPLAVAGMATPLVAALAMSASSITVSLNALRLR
ncbi:cadmium-translocating P-type ATPase [Oceanicola sp. D3]|uniref:heavy metal translocating P-type ATPase n=1 Tax=Oceanicola sp. D3 TaxID=2587163 RepID=UPI00111CA1C3|nr:heavy metal translocating P-type ATPase [Oceanicola sp. D3]QDC08308.1 cadmium-translocating P-type ATPase [Oceanicola sp. D3]